MNIVQSIRRIGRQVAGKEAVNTPVSDVTKPQPAAKKPSGFSRQDRNIRIIWTVLVATLVQMYYLHGATGQVVLDVSPVLLGIVAASIMLGLIATLAVLKHLTMSVRSTTGKTNLFDMVGVSFVCVAGLAAFSWPFLIEGTRHTAYLAMGIIAASLIFGSFCSRTMEAWLVWSLFGRPKPQPASPEPVQATTA